MKQFQVEIINVGTPSFVKTGKGPNGGYSTLEIVIRKDGKVGGKKFVDFGAGVALFSQFKNAQPGQVYNVTEEKQGDYLQWVSASLSDTAVASVENNAVVQSAETPRNIGGSGYSGPAGAGGGRVTGSNYETPQERAVKQAIIVRQAMINAAIDYAKGFISDGHFKEDDVIDLAKKFESFVYDSVAFRAGEYEAAVLELKNKE